ncbi:expressed unknown protein [Seminavis robusta]|uniref:Uncharacterized protein n=1 Tax=Seminavis robusta TaxID=568900 RepID=A0A9N8HKE3_9STRA|nr:expressed unknown protein [Seminavis robusta]|eukprot:Sro937_g222200.1 n/a (179) ;mRNA; r:22281-23210
MKFAALFVTLLLAPAAATLRATTDRKLEDGDEDSYHGGAPGDVSDYLTAEIPVFITETVPSWLNNILCFSGGFALISYQDFVHMALSPLRILASFSSISYTEAGIPTYASAGIDFAFWTQQQNIFVQAALFAVFFVLAGSSMLLENTFGPTMAPFALMAAGAAWAMSGKITVRKLKSV